MFKGTAPLQFLDFFIELYDESDGCYRPGEKITGRIVISLDDGIVKYQRNDVEYCSSVTVNDLGLELLSLKLNFLGFGRLKCKTKAPDSVKELKYLNEESELLSAEILLKTKCEKFFEFQQVLHSDLRTSVESRSGSVFYYIRAMCTYRTHENEIKTVCTARGFTIVEHFDLNCLQAHYFSPASYSLVKKFGLFSCTGGQICLQFSVCKRAFVCGENITIEGCIENKTDRRMDKVTAILQQIVMIIGNTKNLKEFELNIFDVCDIYEDNLALFVDEMSTIKIDKNFALPPLPPSSFTLEGIEPSNLSINACKNSISYRTSATDFRKFSGLGTQSADNNRRFLKILYQLSVRVKTGGTDLMEVNVPIVIGNVPRADLNKKCQQNDSLLNTNKFPNQQTKEKGILYLQNRKERSFSMAESNFNYISTKSQLNYSNRYPYFVDLPTSSKQSRKVSALANAIKNETKVASMFHKTLQHASTVNNNNSACTLRKNSAGAQSLSARGARTEISTSESTDSAHNLMVLSAPALAKQVVAAARPLEASAISSKDTIVTKTMEKNIMQDHENKVSIMVLSDSDTAT